MVSVWDTNSPQAVWQLRGCRHTEMCCSSKSFMFLSFPSSFTCALVTPGKSPPETDPGILILGNCWAVVCRDIKLIVSIAWLRGALPWQLNYPLKSDHYPTGLTGAVQPFVQSDGTIYFTLTTVIRWSSFATKCFNWLLQVNFSMQVDKLKNWSVSRVVISMSLIPNLETEYSLSKSTFSCKKVSPCLIIFVIFCKYLNTES